MTAQRGVVALLASHSRAWRVAALLPVLFAAACATTPPPAPPAPEPPPIPVAPPPMACPTCDDQNREVARLKAELARRDAEVRDLRSQQGEQAKVMQEAARQAVRAKVKLRRLASQANAASYIAEVEVALETLRASPDAQAKRAQLAMPQSLLERASAAYAQGDYASAMDRAAQAEELIAMLAAPPSRTAAAARSRAEVPFESAIPMRVRIDCNLRRQPAAKAPIIGIVVAASPVRALAWKGNWLRVETADRRSGWVHQSLVALP
jgi:hypothetical protein